MPFELGRVDQLGFDSDGIGGIILDDRVVRWKRNGETVEGVAYLVVYWTSAFRRPERLSAPRGTLMD